MPNHGPDPAFGVGETAFSVAAARAIHSSAPHPLIADPFAAVFIHAAQVDMPTSLDEATARFPGQSIWADSADYIAVRSRVGDDFLRETTLTGIRQVVILAAGLDARAYRLDFPADTSVYEIDHSHVLGFKDGALAAVDARPHCRRRSVAANLNENWWDPLSAAGFSSRQPTAWLAEGLLPYLTPSGERDLFSAVHGLSAAGSQWAIEATNNLAAMRDQPSFATVARESGRDVRPLLHGDDRPYPADTLRALGWTVRIEPAADAAQRHGQPIGPAMQGIAALNQFLLATRDHTVNPDGLPKST